MGVLESDIQERQIKNADDNKLKTYNLSSFSTLMKIKIGFKHYNNLSTIGTGQEESFFQLAKLDIKTFLYNNLKHFDKIDTVYGSIDLHIEDWANAENDRMDMMTRMKESSNLANFPSLYYRQIRMCLNKSIYIMYILL